MNAHAPQVDTSTAAIIRFHEAMAEAHRALADLARARAGDAAEPLTETVLPSPLVARGTPETVSTGEGREERAVAPTVAPSDAPLLEPAPVETAPDEKPKPRTKTEQILDLWAEGTMTQAEIAKAVGTRKTSVSAILCQQRKAGDPRAVRRDDKAPSGKGERAIELWKTTTLSAREIALRINSPVSTVTSAISLAGLTVADRPKPEPAPSLEPAAPAVEPMVPRREPPEPPPSVAKETDLLSPADQVLIVRDWGDVIGPRGSLNNVPRPTRNVLARLAALREDQFLDEKVLCEIGPFDHERLRLALSAMTPRLAGIGVELFQPMKGFWRIRRIDGEARS